MDVSRGINKKGRIPGAGNLARAYRDFSSCSSSRSSTGRSYVRDQAVVNELAKKLEESEKSRSKLEETVSELKTQMTQGLDAMRDEMRAQQKLIIELMSWRGASISPTNRSTPHLAPRSTLRPTSMPYPDAPYPTGSQSHYSPPLDGLHYSTRPDTGGQYWHGPRPGEFGVHFATHGPPSTDPSNTPPPCLNVQSHQVPYFPRLPVQNPRPTSDATTSTRFTALLRRSDQQLHDNSMMEDDEFLHDAQPQDP